jgi:Flp pilus assembly protein CpaB
VRSRAALLAVSVAVALVGTGLIAFYVHDADARAQRKVVGDGRLTPLYVVTRDVPAGTSVSQVNVARRSFAAGSIPPDAVTDLDAIAGKVTASTLFAGAPLVGGMFTDSGAARGAEIELTGVAPGNIVVPVRIGGLDAMSEALTPGVEVTLFHTVKGDTKVIVPRIGVVRVVRGTGDGEGGTGRIDALLLQASPRDAALITAANRAQSLDVGLPGSRAAVTTSVGARVQTSE